MTTPHIYGKLLWSRLFSEVTMSVINRVLHRLVLQLCNNLRRVELSSVMLGCNEQNEEKLKVAAERVLAGALNFYFTA